MNEDLDAVVLRAIDEGKHRNMDIAVRLSQAVGASTDYRRLDRVLQRLRKRGLIVFASKIGWVRAENEPCPHCEGTGRRVAGRTAS